MASFADKQVDQTSKYTADTAVTKIAKSNDTESRKWKTLKIFLEINLFIDEFGEAFLSLSSGYIASVVAPDQNTAFDIERKNSAEAAPDII